MKLCSLEERNWGGLHNGAISGRFCASPAPPACSRKARGEGLVAVGPPVTGRRGGCAEAAGRTVLAAGAAAFDCLILCPAFHGLQLQGWAPDSLPDRTTCLSLSPGQVEVASQSSSTWEGLRGRERQGCLPRGIKQGHGHRGPGGNSSPSLAVLEPQGQEQSPHPVPGPPQCLASCITHRDRKAVVCVSPIQYCISGAEHSAWHIVGIHWIPAE